ncbi:membrane protein [Candidatus Magnetobacterium bavaricum]|uniref:Membrane protein n=1 Tax=Candidatus Magnetobacterium bavaricum TaxID=29290 RepID=A0A0F3GI64_9BACT|nr:membrane protein [Candidatus Magnetobacterium bavaricum]
MLAFYIQSLLLYHLLMILLYNKRLRPVCHIGDGFSIFERQYQKNAFYLYHLETYFHPFIGLTSFLIYFYSHYEHITSQICHFINIHQNG